MECPPFCSPSAHVVPVFLFTALWNPSFQHLATDLSDQAECIQFKTMFYHSYKQELTRTSWTAGMLKLQAADSTAWDTTVCYSSCMWSCPSSAQQQRQVKEHLQRTSQVPPARAAPVTQLVTGSVHFTLPLAPCCRPASPQLLCGFINKRKKISNCSFLFLKKWWGS